MSGFRIARIVMLAALVASALPAQAPVPAPETPAATVRETIEVTAVTVALRVESRGGPREPQLATADVVVREDGEARRVVGLVRLAASAEPVAPAPPAIAPAEAAPPPEPAARPTRVAIYIDVPMTTGRVLASVVRRFADLADELVAAGEVEVVLADPEPHQVVAPTRDARSLGAGLRALIGRGGARTAIERIRLPILRGEDDLGGHRDQLLQRATEEIRYLEGRRLRLGVWAASTPSYGRPRILYLVSGGYDSDPRDFYVERLRTPGGGGAGGGVMVRETVPERTLFETDLERLAQGPAEAALGGDLATLGWLVFPVALADVGFETFGGAEEPGDSRWFAMARGSSYGTTGAQPFLFTHPVAGWTTLAAPTGGTAFGSERELARSVRALGDLYLLTYERSGALTGASHRLEVESRRAEFVLHAPARIAEGTPESAAAVAAVRRLSGCPPESDLPIALEVLASRPAGAGRELRLGVRVEVGALAAAVGPAFGSAVRLTLAVPDGAGSADVIQKLTAAPAGATGTWSFELVTRAPASARELALRVEDLASGLAGSALLDLTGAPAAP